MVIAAATTAAAVYPHTRLGVPLPSPAGLRTAFRQLIVPFPRQRTFAPRRCLSVADSPISIPVAAFNPSSSSIRPRKPGGDMGVGGHFVAAADGALHPPASVTAATHGEFSAATAPDPPTGLSTGLSSRWWPGAADASPATAGQPMASPGGDGGGGDDAVTIVVMGDLHLEPGQMTLFHEARDQIVRLLAGDQENVATDPSNCTENGRTAAGSETTGSVTNGESANGSSNSNGKSALESDAPSAVPPALLIQLGDVGGYSNKPGSAECFRSAVSFLDSFRLPRLSVTGNHDLEGSEFESDERNLLAWKDAFRQEHYWRRDLGDAGVCLGLSTVRFRDSPDSCHEVFIDEEQVAWMTTQLAAVEAERMGRPVFVFTHAPPMGCGLTSLQEVHVRNRCAWLNHSCPSTSRKFLELVRSHSCIKLWFSGHFHLSHDYEGSLSRVASCLFVQTGVMGGCHRDGRRHSRVLRATKSGYHLLTLDHSAGEVRTDVRHVYENEARGIPPQRLWCSTLSGMSACAAGGAFSPIMPADLAARDQDQFPPFARGSVGGWGRANGAAASAGEDAADGASAAAAGAASAAAGAASAAAGVGLGSPAKRRNTNTSTSTSSNVSSSISGSGTVRWLQMGETVLAVHANQILQYDPDLRAPIGIVCDAVNGRSIRLVAEGRVGDGNGGANSRGRKGEVPVLEAVELHPTEESKWLAVSLRRTKGSFEFERIERNEEGEFWRVFQLNKWRVRLAKEAAEAAAKAEAMAAPAAAPAAAAASVAGGIVK
ncbi:unnamed protein product [Closterium sp. NIES-53]